MEVPRAFVRDLARRHFWLRGALLGRSPLLVNGDGKGEVEDIASPAAEQYLNAAQRRQRAFVDDEENSRGKLRRAEWKERWRVHTLNFLEELEEVAKANPAFESGHLASLTSPCSGAQVNAASTDGDARSVVRKHPSMGTRRTVETGLVRYTRSTPAEVGLEAQPPRKSHRARRKAALARLMPLRRVVAKATPKTKQTGTAERNADDEEAKTSGFMKRKGAIMRHTKQQLALSLRRRRSSGPTIHRVQHTFHRSNAGPVRRILPPKPIPIHPIRKSSRPSTTPSVSRRRYIRLIRSLFRKFLCRRLLPPESEETNRRFDAQEKWRIQRNTNARRAMLHDWEESMISRYWVGRRRKERMTGEMEYSRRGEGVWEMVGGADGDGAEGERGGELDGGEGVVSSGMSELLSAYGRDEGVVSSSRSGLLSAYERDELVEDVEAYALSALKEKKGRRRR